MRSVVAPIMFTRRRRINTLQLQRIYNNIVGCVVHLRCGEPLLAGIAIEQTAHAVLPHFVPHDVVQVQLMLGTLQIGAREYLHLIAAVKQPLRLTAGRHFRSRRLLHYAPNPAALTAHPAADLRRLRDGRHLHLHHHAVQRHR